MESSERNDLRLNEDQKLKIYQIMNNLRRQLILDGLEELEPKLALWNKSLQNCQQKGLMKTLYNSKLKAISDSLNIYAESKSIKMFKRIDQLTRELFEN